MVEVGVRIVFSGVGYFLARRQGDVQAKIVSSIGEAAFDQIGL